MFYRKGGDIMPSFSALKAGDKFLATPNPESYHSGVFVYVKLDERVTLTVESPCCLGKTYSAVRMRDGTLADISDSDIVAKIGV